MEKEQIEKAAELHYTQITLAERTAFKFGVNWALSQPTADLDVMAQYRKDLQTPNVGLEQKPVESDAVEFAISKMWFEARKPYSHLIESTNKVMKEYHLFKQSKNGNKS